MNREFLAVFVSMILAFLSGCATNTEVSEIPGGGKNARALCEEGNYHAAMRELPKAMKAWAEYTERTGSTCEGAAGYLYATTMSRISSVADAHWGRILDDPQIPYEYKTDMIFEILEARLGKGAVYVGNKKNFIVPRYDSIDLNKERIKLPE